MTIETKTAAEDIASRLSGISAELDQATAAQATAQEAHDSMAGLRELGEASDQDVESAEQVLVESKRHVSALASAKKVLEGRAAEQAAQKEQERIQRLRQESKAAAAAEAKALLSVAQWAEKLVGALEAVRAQGSVLSALYSQLAEASPETAANLEQDRRDTFAHIGTVFAAKKSAINEAAASGQYMAQRPSDGTDPSLATDLVLLGNVVAEAGTPLSTVREQVLAWQIAALARLDSEIREMQQQSQADHIARTEVGLGAHLPATMDEVRAATSLPVDALTLLISDDAARALAALTAYLPASATEAISVRAITMPSALEARQSDAKLQAGRAALVGLAGR